MKPKFSGKVHGGKLELYDRELFLKHCRTLEGLPVFISIERETNNRTSKQNAYLWAGPYRVISDCTGFTPDEVHEMMKAKFNRRFKEVVNKQTGEVEEIEFAGSTTKMTTVEFSEYVEKIIAWASEFLGVVIPLPGEILE